MKNAYVLIYMTFFFIFLAMASSTSNPILSTFEYITTPEVYTQTSDNYTTSKTNPMIDHVLQLSFSILMLIIFILAIITIGIILYKIYRKEPSKSIKSPIYKDVVIEMSTLSSNI